MKPCAMCHKEFHEKLLDFLERCEPCFRAYVTGNIPDKPLLFQSTHNPHNSKETKAYVERLEQKRWTPQGVDHRYKKRIYG